MSDGEWTSDPLWPEPIDGGHEEATSNSELRVHRVRKCGCGWWHSAWDVRAVGRFRPEGLAGFRAHPDGPVRQERHEAMRDVCPFWGRHVPASIPTTQGPHPNPAGH